MLLEHFQVLFIIWILLQIKSIVCDRTFFLSYIYIKYVFDSLHKNHEKSEENEKNDAIGLLRNVMERPGQAILSPEREIADRNNGVPWANDNSLWLVFSPVSNSQEHSFEIFGQYLHFQSEITPVELE